MSQLLRLCKHSSLASGPMPSQFPSTCCLFSNPFPIAPPVRVYLIAYNTLSALAWAHVLVSLLVHLLNLDGNSDSDHVLENLALIRFLSQISFSNVSQTKISAVLLPLYERAQTTYLRIGTETAFVQSFAILDVLHVVLGWVRAPLPTAATQVFSRLLLVWGITKQFPLEVQFSH